MTKLRKFIPLNVRWGGGGGTVHILWEGGDCAHPVGGGDRAHPVETTQQT